jgi:lysophospholipase L1-like esterase
MTSLLRIEKMLAVPSEQSDITWLFCGDSITHGVVYLDDHRDYTEIFHHRLRMELGRRHDAVIRTAISGWTTRDTLADIERRILKYSPDVLSVMLGMNDCESEQKISLAQFRDNLNTILDQAADRSDPALILHTTNPIWEIAKDSRGNLPEYNQAIRDIAADRHAVLVDHETYWQDMLAKYNKRMTLWMGDSLHPNNYGHVAFAHHLFSSLQIWDGNAQSCQFYKP